MYNKDVLSRYFLSFAKKECKGSSPLYEHLSLKIAEDNDLLEISANAQEGQPVPNLFLSAVHNLLLKGSKHPLKQYYPSLAANPKSYKSSFITFKDFCLEYRNEIESILKTRLVQTNEVGRCAYLYPAFCTVYQISQRPLALMEIGTSAGLQLLWDKFSYSYGAMNMYGNKNSKLDITAEIRGKRIPPLHSTPPVSMRVGFDLNTIDLNDEDEKLWLKSLIWPEHKERMVMFEKAASYIDTTPVNLVEGDAISLLSKYVEKIPQDSVICIFHTHVANQIPDENKKQLMKTVESIGIKRDIFHIYNNMQDRYLHLDYYLNQIESHNTIAETDGHGRWFSWLLENKVV